MKTPKYCPLASIVPFSPFAPEEMQLQFIFSITAFLSLLFFLFKRRKTHSSINKLPPGPRKLPLIGNLHLVGSLTHRSLRDLAKKYGDIMHLQLGEISTIVISSPQMAKEVLKTHDLAFANRMKSMATDIMFYQGSDIAFCQYGDYWRQMRKICILELLSAKNVKSFLPIREDEAWNLITSIQSSPGLPINLAESFFSMTSAILCRAAFGKKNHSKDVVKMLMKELAHLLGGGNIADLFPSMKLLPVLTRTKFKLLKMHKKLDDILESIIKEHRETLKSVKNGHKDQSDDEDLVDVLLRLQETGGLDLPISNQNIKAVIFDMFSAGTETSSSTLEWAMTEVIRNPRVMKKVQTELRQAFEGKERICEADIQELSYLKLVIKETLRLHPPIPLLIPRESRDEVELDGYKIPIKTAIMVNVWAIGRDSRYWHDADKFEPERFYHNSVDFMGSHFEYIPFGAGRRICPGMSFALATIALPLAQLLYHFDWKFPSGMNIEYLDMAETSGINGSRSSNLYLIATPYVPFHD